MPYPRSASTTVSPTDVPLYTIGTLVGHKNTLSTQLYAKLSPDAKWEALKVIEQTATAHKS